MSLRLDANCRSLPRDSTFASSRRVLVLLISAAALLQALAFPVQGADDPKASDKLFDLQVKPFLKQYCARCHNA